MEEKIKEESMDGFVNLLGNLKAERFFGVSHNNSKDDLNLLGDLLDLQKLDKENLLDTKDFIALDPLHETFDDGKNNELVERAFKTELRLNSEPFIIFSRNNGIAKRQKKKKDSQSPMANHREEMMDEMQYSETIENYLSLPLREETHLDFTLQPPTLSTEMTNFESLGPNRNIVPDLPNIPGAQRSENMEIRQDAPAFSNTVHENIPFILGHPSQMGQMGQMGTLKEPEIDHDNDFIRVEKKENREFSIHEISFNRDQFSNSMRTDQDTARSLQLAKHYEMVEEEVENGGGIISQKRNADEFPLQMTQDRYRDTGHFKTDTLSSQKNVKEESMSPFMMKPQNEPMKNFGLEKIVNENNQDNYKSESENMDTNTLAAENHLLNIFYQLMNENKQLKQEMSTVHERLDEMARHKEAETEIVCNLQQNLELTMMLLKKRDEEFTKLQKKYDDLARNFQNYVDQNSAPPHQEYYLGPSKSNSFMAQDLDQQVNGSRELSMDRSTRRSSSFTSAVHNGVRTSKTDLQRPLQNENLRSQKSFPTHFSETHSVYDHDMGYDNSVEHRRNSSYSLRTSVQQNVDKRDPNYDTSGEYDSRYGNMYPNNKVLQNLAKKSSFGNQQVVQERDDFTNNLKQQNPKGLGLKNENVSAKNWHEKEQERGGMKENRYGQNAGNRPSSVDPNNSNSGWTGANVKQSVEKLNEAKPKSKVQNYKKYSEMFKKQKEAFDHGMNFQREEIKSKIQPRK